MSTLLRFDPFREIDRVLDQAMSQTRRPSFPMDAYRHGDTVVVHFDLPGVDPESIDLEYERQGLTVTAERSWRPVEGDQLLASERIHGRFQRQLLLGDGLDVERMHASYENGVLTVTIPVAEKAKPRKIEIAVGGQASIPVAQPAVEATAS
ncbi:MAG TPA: Hsp20/alpha crystallin family protein [Ilumatobacteraceae bacterium]|nr:Hsp20/alpha crystallin family protein [Ilumatobacteraceae bacterium]